MFEGFTRTEIATSGARIHLHHGGDGPPLLLLHGNPLTHVFWHKIVEHRSGQTAKPVSSRLMAPPLRNRRFVDSPLEEAVCCEPVSEMELGKLGVRRENGPFPQAIDLSKRLLLLLFFECRYCRGG
jgi:hypothetical protein